MLVFGFGVEHLMVLQLERIGKVQLDCEMSGKRNGLQIRAPRALFSDQELIPIKDI